MNVKLLNLFLIIFLFSLCSETAFPQEIKKELCVSVDDLPYITKVFKDFKTGQYITGKLLSAFKEFGVIALGSVNSGKLFTNDKLDSNKLVLLNQWLDSGMTLGNHTFAHKNYNKISFSEFKTDILGGETCLKDILEKRNQKLIYFRHPHLFRGETKEKADSLQYFLDSIGYIIAPVTIDNSDYIFSWAYEKALSSNNDSLAKRIGKDYIDYMSDVMDYFESQSLKITGYNVKHILLMHANLLNADYIGELLKMYSGKGYSFISIEEALKDKCYIEFKDEFYQKSGISWLHRWALTMGKRGDFFKGEPDVPLYITEMLK
jgi:peptidoglycan/xylan/chitin deacetylase (PgdA/CDA1 family)